MIAKRDVFQKVLDKVPAYVLEIASAIERAGGRVYVVGGAVRDALLGIEPSDWDLGTTLEPVRVVSLFTSVETDGIEFGRVRVSGVDVVSLRAEAGYLDRRHPSDVRMGATIEEDLERRDFTVNAIALDLNSHEVVDPFKGQEDLDRRVIRTVGRPEDRFSEDPLRILRAFRLKAELGFNIAPEVVEAARGLSRLISYVPGQRCFSEIEAILLSHAACPAILELWDAGILQVMLPEIFPASPSREGCSGRDTILYLGKTVGFCPESLPVRLAALFHMAPPGGWTEASRRFGLSSKVSSYVKSLLQGVPTGVADQPGYTVRKIVKEGGPERLRDLVALEIAKSLAARGDPAPAEVVNLMEGIFSSRPYSPESYLKLKITGDEIMKEAGFRSGPELGEVIAYLEDAILRNPELNTKEKLLLLTEEWRKNRVAEARDEGEAK